MSFRNRFYKNQIKSRLLILFIILFKLRKLFILKEGK